MIWLLLDLKNNIWDFIYDKYKVTNLTVDIVYGDYVPLNCSVSVQPTLKTSFKFKESIYSRKNSGGPGYKKGKPVLIG